jgi:hypothetical protein
MGITVHRDVVAGLTPEATITLQARSTAAPDRLLAAMRAAAADVSSLDGPTCVGPVVPLPDGPVLIVDLGATPTQRLRGLPDLIIRRLAEAGVADADIVRAAVATPRYLPLRDLRPAARAVLRGPLAAPHGSGPADPPLGLLEAAAEWLPAEHRPGARLTGLAGSVEIDLSLTDVTAVMGDVVSAGATAIVVSTDGAAASAAVVGARPGKAGAAARTSAGGDAAEGAAALRRQREVLRRHAPRVVWAGATVEPDASDLLFLAWRDRDEHPPRQPGGSDPARPAVEWLADVLVPDAMWCQVLSSGHVERLGGPPPGAVEVAADRYELTLGEPEQWLPGHPDRDAVRSRGRDVLAACLVSAAEATRLSRERVRSARRGRPA